MPIILFFLISFITFYFCWFFLEESRKRKYSPPGPPALPFVGSVPYIALAHPEPHMALVKLAEQYGDVMRVKLGSHEYVILSSAEALNDILSREETAGRPDHGVLKDRAEIPNTGIVFSVGNSWKTKRLWMTRTLREMGIGRTSFFEETTRSMVTDLHSKLHEGLTQSGKIITVDKNLSLGAVTMIWRLLTGSNTPEDDADCEAFLHANEKWMENGAFGDGLLLIAPILKHVLPGLTGYKAQMEFFQVGRELGNKWYSKLINSQNDSPSTFLNSYIHELKKGRPGFFEKDFNMTFNDVMAAAVETSNSFIQSLLLFLTLHPDKQESLYKELTTNFPPDHIFTIADLKSMPYTQSFMLEVHRLAIVATNWAPRTLTGDITYRKYILKKGTTILPSPHAAFKSKADFGPDPEVFRPERYIDPQDPFKLTDLKKLVTPFSIGKRVCPGESVAQIVAFLTLVSTVKNFSLSPVPGETPPSSEFIVGFTSKPHPFRALLSLRDKTQLLSS